MHRNLLKPKDVTQQLNISHYDLIKYCKQIEFSNIHKFPRTPLGSFLFSESEIELIFEYIKIIKIFKQKELSLMMLEKRHTKSKRPDWFRYIRLYQ